MLVEYFKGILPDLQESSCKFADTELVASNSKESVRTNSLILASLSPTLKSILLNHSASDHSAEENFKILIPDLTFDVLQHFFSHVIFKIDDTLEVDSSLDEVVDLLGITLPSKSTGAAEASKSHANFCDICNKEFSLPKLLKRHMKTYHHNVSHASIYFSSDYSYSLLFFVAES